jgi:4-hydroxybenzoate polyprenyltransferase
MGLILLIAIGLALLALLPSMIAQEKGRPMGPWFLYGFILFPIALVHALFLKTHDRQEKCPKCRKSISVLALECPHCGHELIRSMHV